MLTNKPWLVYWSIATDSLWNRVFRREQGGEAHDHADRPGTARRCGVSLWSMVFPLGMYAVASVHLGEVEDLPWVEHLGRAELWLSFAIWCVVFLGFLRRVSGTLLTRQSRGRAADQQVT